MKPKKPTQNLFKIIWKFLLCCFKKLKEWALHYRFGFLVGAAAAGWGLMSNAPLIIDYLYPAIGTTNSRLTTSLTILLLSLPVFCLLWFFRTHDTKEQLQKSQTNINTNMLHNSIDLALASQTNDKNQVEIDPVKRAIGLRMLAQLRRTDPDPEFKKQIDFVTKGLDLKGVNLVGANLREANLQGADLQGANLEKARLQKAHLQKAHLQKANLQKADLQGAYLKSADLQGARYNSTTYFPSNFNPQDAGMIDTDMIENSPPQ